VDLDYSTNLDNNMKLMNMISKLNVNSKVGKVLIEMDSYNEHNKEILKRIVSTCRNVYYIGVFDSNDKVDSGVHSYIKQLVN